jgi:aquaglyceroporin related protein
MSTPEITPSPQPSFSHHSLPSTACSVEKAHHSVEKADHAVNRMGVETAHNEHIGSEPSTPAPSITPPQETQLAWSKTRSIWQDAFSEFFGVFIMILFGDGVVAQVVLSDGKKGDYQSISWGWGYGKSLPSIAPCLVLTCVSP